MAPVVVKIEADQSEDGQIEKDFPSWNQASVTIKPYSPACGSLTTKSYGYETLSNLGIGISTEYLICKQDSEAGDPSENRKIVSRDILRKFVIGIDDEQDLESGESVQSCDEEEREVIIKCYSLLHVYVGCSVGREPMGEAI